MKDFNKERRQEAIRKINQEAIRKQMARDVRFWMKIITGGIFALIFMVLACARWIDSVHPLIVVCVILAVLILAAWVNNKNEKRRDNP